MTLLSLTEQDGIHLGRVSNFHGGEYAGPCPLCGGRDRFRVWPEEGESGKYWCRGCGKGGDCIQYLRDVRNLSYQDAYSYLGKEPASIDQNRQPVSRPQWEPREIGSPLDEWVLKCSAFLEYCKTQLWGDKGKDILEWLKNERGLSEGMIKTFRLGWNPQDMWRERKTWGLPEELKENGKAKKLWLPAGVVIPCYADEKLQRARIRRFDPDQGPPYCIVSGSSTGPMVLGNNHKIFVIVESELDAIFLNQEIGDMAGIISLGNAQTRPDKITTELLREAELILVALDNDEQRDDGKNPGAQEAWGWWLPHFPQARRLPPVDGKDPCEMWRRGVNLRDWVEIGIEEESTIVLDRESLRVKTVLPLIKNFVPMPLTLDPDFNRAGLIVKFHSDLLNEDFFLVSDEKLRARVEAPGAVAYLPKEIECLAGLRPEEVKRLHMVKKVFLGGEFISVGNVEDSIFNK